MKSSILFDSYCGIGDHIHFRPFVLEALKKYDNVFINSQFPDLFFEGTGVKCIKRKSHLDKLNEYVKKNEDDGLYAKRIPAQFDKRVRFSYGNEIAKNRDPILVSFNKQFPIEDFENISLKFPIKRAWKKEAQEKIFDKANGKKVCYVNFPVERETNVHQVKMRNPKWEYFCRVFDKVKDEYFCVGIHDLNGYRERFAGALPNGLSLALHNGEMSTGAMLATISMADLVLASPGHSLVAGVALDVPTFCVFGGFSPSRIYTEPLKTTKYGFVAPKDCYCFGRGGHVCDKEISLDKIDRTFEDFHDKIKKGIPVLNEYDKPLKDEFYLDKPVFSDNRGKYINVIRHGVERRLYF